MILNFQENVQKNSFYHFVNDFAQRMEAQIGNKAI